MKIKCIKEFFSILALTLFLLLGACSETKEAMVLTGPTMGTQYRITVLSRSTTPDSKQRVAEAVTQAMETVNQSMSTYIPDSELSRFNRMEAGSSLVMSDQLYTVVKESLEISAFSDGAFDATIGKAIRLWGFSEDGTITEKPSHEQINAMKASVGYTHLSIDGNKLTKNVNGLELNLSAIAKGYAVDLVALAIEELGYTDYLVDIGGELRASGKNADGKNWRVGVEKPHLLGGVEQVVNLVNQSIATSGDYRNFHVIDGQRFSHTIDPDTLTPVFHRLASVSVLTERASTADALATALLAMGDEKGLAFAKNNSIAAYFIIRLENEDNYKVVVTDGFKANLAE